MMILGINLFVSPARRAKKKSAEGLQLLEAISISLTSLYDVATGSAVGQLQDPCHTRGRLRW